jgi:AcrR family transcriptional regulator
LFGHADYVIVLTSQSLSHCIADYQTSALFMLTEIAETTAAAPPRRQRRPDLRRSEVLAAALDLFAEKGFAATRLDDVAARAGVAKGTLYLYFKSKEEIFMAVVRESLVATLTSRRAAVESYSGPISALLAFVLEDWWRDIGSTKLSTIPKLVMAEAGNFPQIAEFYLREVILPVQELLAHIFERGMASGEFRRVDPRQVAALFTAPLLMATLWRTTLAPATDAITIRPSERVVLADTPALLRTHLDVLLNGLKP